MKITRRLQNEQAKRQKNQTTGREEDERKKL